MERIVDIDGIGGGESVHSLGEKIVRCRDCVHATPTPSGFSARCGEWSWPDNGVEAYVPFDGFCYMGEGQQ